MAAPPSPASVALLDRFLAALDRRGLVSAAQLAEQQERTDTASPAIGAAMVARAWTDPAFRALMLRDGSAAAEAMGVSMAGMPPLGVLEDTATQRHLVVCTLCSCYPRAVLGYPPGWFKSAAFRARAVSDPRGVLRDWGTELPPGTALRVVDSTADYRWMVLPLRPAGTEGWDAARLAALVTPESMMGVRPAAVPASA
ncbi:nitrile hydratase subunit alpha [Roseomonas elaeocarpi]|uniref:Nitrile hydratase subunit alpha n=1 Tax=Roseomonas elaeocarpi TaxID=907779 RepID=A0ABV6JWA2_9PROT